MTKFLIKKIYPCNSKFYYNIRECEKKEKIKKRLKKSQFYSISVDMIAEITIGLDFAFLNKYLEISFFKSFL